MSWQPLPLPAHLVVGYQVVWIPLAAESAGQTTYLLRGIAGHGFVVDAAPQLDQQGRRVVPVLLWEHFGVTLLTAEAVLIAADELFDWHGVAPELVEAQLLAWQQRQPPVTSGWPMITGNASSFSVAPATLGAQYVGWPAPQAPEAIPLADALANTMPFRNPTMEELTEHLRDLNFPPSVWRKPRATV